MSYRQTFVIEYPDASHAPAVGSDMTMLGGKLVACQFSDALEELESLLEVIEPEQAERAAAYRASLEAARKAAA